MRGITKGCWCFAMQGFPIDLIQKWNHEMAIHPRLTVAVRFLLQYLLFLLLQESLSKFRPIILWTYDLCLCHLSENMSDRHSTYAKAWNWGYSPLTPCRLMIVGGRIFLKQKIALTACKKRISTQYSWH